MGGGGRAIARMKKLSFWYFLFIISGFAVCAQLVGFYIPLYFREIGLKGIHAGMFFAVSTVANLILSLPMGVATDRKSIRIILFVSFVLVALSYVGFIISDALLVICSFALAGGFGKKFFAVSSNTMFFKLSGTNSLRNAALFMLLRTVSMGVGTIIGGFLIDMLSYRHVFFLTVGGNLLLAGLSMGLPRTENVAIELAEYRRTVLTPKVLFLAAVFSLSSMHWGAEMVAYSPFLKHNLGLPIPHLGIFTGTGFMLVGVGSILGAFALKKRWVSSLRQVLIIGLILSGVFHVLMCIPVLYVSYACRLFHEIGDGLVMLAFYSGIPKVFHIDKIGGCAAFMGLCMGVTAMGSSVAFGHIGDVWGHQWPLIISGIVLASIPLLLKLGGDLLGEAQ